MPIIVDEVVISVEVGGGAVAGGSRGGAPGAAMGPEEKAVLVAECVERVLDVLARREER
jgi:hypothetical protein